MVKCINIVKTARNGGYFCFIILQNIVSEARGTAWNVLKFSDPALHPLRQLVQAAHHVGRQALVDLLGVGEVEPLHDRRELGQVLGQPRVELLLLGHGGVHHALVVVGGVQEEGVWQGEDLVPHAAVEGAGAPALEVSPPAPADQESVASEGAAVLPGMEI